MPISFKVQAVMTSTLSRFNGPKVLRLVGLFGIREQRCVFDLHLWELPLGKNNSFTEEGFTEIITQCLLHQRSQFIQEQNFHFNSSTCV